MKCKLCDEEANFACAGCQLEFYCSKEHEVEDCAKHKTTCCPVIQIEDDAGMGRVLVAGRRVAKGELVLVEKPLVSGPPQLTGPVCLSCYTPLTLGTSIPCPQCGWPLCSLGCSKSKDHRPECKWATSKRNAKVKISNFCSPHPTYACLLALRCCYLRDNDPEAWSRLQSLEAHEAERQGSEKLQADRFAVAGLLRRFYCLEQEFTEEDILRICGIIQINGHEVPLSEQGYVSLFWRGSLLEHSCRASCSKSFSGAGELVIRAAWELAPGDRLSICYTDPLWPTPARRSHLRSTKYFSCVCPRCSDPTELGTYMSAVLCPKEGCKGKVTPESFLSSGSSWSCKTCGDQVSGSEVASVLTRVGSCPKDKGDVHSLRRWLTIALRDLPENHAGPTEAALALAQALGQSLGPHALNQDELFEKASLCSKLLALITNLVPAECRIQGILTFEMHATIAETARRRAEAGLIDGSELRNLLMESKRYLEDCIEFLKYEPLALPEGQIARQAERNLLDLELVLRGLHTTIGDCPL